MRNPELWKPTKIRTPSTPGHPPLAGAASRGAPQLAAASQPLSVGAGSTLMATLVGRWYAQVLAQHARGVLLELGSGALPYYALYRDRVDTVWCLDWPQSLHLQPHADLWCDLNAGIPLGSGLADTLILADVLEHIYRPQALLSDMHRVLRPGGVALLNTPFMYWVHEAPHDYFRYTPHALERMAREAGFEVLRLDAVGGGLCILADVSGKLLQSLRVLGLGVGAPLARGMQRAALALLAGRGPLPLSASSPLFVAVALRRPV
jgi:SAM-dependent methyltransferase